jgi:hypothetical protein
MGWFRNLNWLGFLFVFLVVGGALGGEGYYVLMTLFGGGAANLQASWIELPLELLTAAAFGMFTGFIPALATGFLAWLLQSRLQPSLYVLACLALGATTSAAWGLMSSGLTLNPAFAFEIEMFSLLGAIAGAVCGILTAPRRRSSLPTA